MASRARSEQEDLAIRVAALEAALRALEQRLADGAAPGSSPSGAG
jgi:BMFP domain-containing protein YqiC